jgi:glycosyltransferase involved in cell wall biosynthesis
VVFLGAVAQSDVAELLAAADVVAVPSVRDDAGNVDGLPNVLLEALASGTPVVATAAGGMGTVAIDGETARVVPERSPEQLAVAIDELLRRPEYGTQLGRQARSDMRRTHSWARVAERFEEAYSRAAERLPVSS